jgi:hypothetical protein
MNTFSSFQRVIELAKENLRLKEVMASLRSEYRDAYLEDEAAIKEVEVYCKDYLFDKLVKEEQPGRDD